MQGTSDSQNITVVDKSGEGKPAGSILDELIKLGCAGPASDDQ